MRGLICFISFMVLVLYVEILPIPAIIGLLATFGWTSKKYWVK